VVVFNFCVLILLITAKFTPITFKSVTLKLQLGPSMWALLVFQVFGSSFHTIACLIALHATNAILCDVTWRVCIFGYFVMLMGMYGILSLKARSVNEGFEASRWLVLCSKAMEYMLPCLIPCGIIFSALGLHGSITTIEDGRGNLIDNGGLYCVLFFEEWTVIIMPLMDFMMNIGYLIMFAVPLTQFVRQIGDSDPKAEDYKRLVKESFAFCVVTVTLVTMAFMSFFLSQEFFNYDFECVSCSIGIFSGFSSTLLALYQTRRAWKVEHAQTLAMASLPNLKSIGSSGSSARGGDGNVRHGE